MASVFLSVLAESVNSLLSRIYDFSVTSHNKLVLFHYIFMVFVKPANLSMCPWKMDYYYEFFQILQKSLFEEDSTESILNFLTFFFNTTSPYFKIATSECKWNLLFF